MSKRIFLGSVFEPALVKSGTHRIGSIFKDMFDAQFPDPKHRPAYDSTRIRLERIGGTSASEVYYELEDRDEFKPLGITLGQLQGLTRGALDLLAREVINEMDRRERLA